MTNFYRWNGKGYRGMPAVARDAKCSVYTVAKHLERYGHLDNLGKLVGRRPLAEVVIDGKLWVCRDLAAHLGISRDTLRGWIKNGDKDRIREKLRAAA